MGNPGTSQGLVVVVVVVVVMLHQHLTRRRPQTRLSLSLSLRILRSHQRQPTRFQRRFLLPRSLGRSRSSRSVFSQSVERRRSRHFTHTARHTVVVRGTVTAAFNTALVRKHLRKQWYKKLRQQRRHIQRTQQKGGPSFSQDGSRASWPSHSHCTLQDADSSSACEDRRPTY